MMGKGGQEVRGKNFERRGSKERWGKLATNRKAGKTKLKKGICQTEERIR